MTRSRRILAALLVATFVAALGSLPASPASAAAFTHTETVSRSTLNADGTSTVVDKRTFSVSVSQTAGLRGQQQIDVSWTGAHPTGGLVSDPNSTLASLQEYPVVILECRGVDSATVAAAQRVDPTTCWTQTPDERYQGSFQTAYPAWRLDRYETPDHRSAQVDAPPTTLNCDIGASATRWVPFRAADTTVYYWGSNGTCGIPPEGSLLEDPAAPPANGTYAPTGADGKGTAGFDIWTAAENGSLGCSNTVPCSLEIIPIMGISCDPTAKGLPVDDQPPAEEVDADAGACEATGLYAPGQPFSTDHRFDPTNDPVIGALWWSASNWRNRVSVPLTFAPPANVCDTLDNRIPVDIYGSELMNQASLLWQARFCQDSKLFKYQHVSTGEPQAESALANGSISAALVSNPPSSYAIPTVNAPVSVTGFAISFAVDGADGHPYANLKLTPRLLAKLLTESYWGQISLQRDFARLPASNKYAKMAKNPQDIAVDPDFTRLNPGIGVPTETQASATLLALSGNSDVMYALTSYINADPDARAFLNGTPDPWGMTVNPSYKGITLPRGVWPLQDTFLSPDIDLGGCLRNDDGNIVPVPILPLIAAPMATLAGIAQAMQFAIANPQTACSPVLQANTNKIIGGTLKATGRQPTGRQFMLGVTAVGDATLYGLHSASLQSSPGHFVAPTVASMRAAIVTAKENTSTHTWPMAYAKLRTVAAAYPGTMVVYALIPATGVDATTAGELAKFLLYATSDGQKPGEDIGQLPPGYLPMTAANGLSAMIAYTKQAATLVAAQNGTTLPPTSPPAGSTGGSGSGAGSGTGTGATSPVPPPTGKPSATPSPSASAYIPPVDLPKSYTMSVKSSSASWALPVAVLVSIVAMVIAIIIRTISGMNAAANLDNRLRRLAENGDRQ